MYPNLNNVNPETLRQQSAQMQNMSDEQLQQQLNMAKGMMPGLAGGNKLC